MSLTNMSDTSTGTTGKGKGALILVGTPIALIGVLFTLVILFTAAPASASCTGKAGSADTTNMPARPVAGYGGDQLSNAALIMNAGSAFNVDRSAQVIAVMTAMGESGLKVLDNGDAAGPDSRGLFQQRDNGAWGSYEDRMDPTISATIFFTGLMRTTGWEQLAPTIAAHRVQGNADPFHYEDYFAAADEVVTALSGGGGGCASGSLVMPLSAGYTMTDDYGPRVRPTAGASSWHPAVDLQHSLNPCSDQIMAITSGTVTLIAGYQVSIKAPAGYTVSYLHMKLSDVAVKVGDTITPGQPIALVGSEGPSTGCHLDLRINVEGTTDTQVAGLTQSQTLGAPVSGFVDPEEFYALHGSTLCDTTCTRKLSP